MHNSFARSCALGAAFLAAVLVQPALILADGSPTFMMPAPAAAPAMQAVPAVVATPAPALIDGHNRYSAGLQVGLLGFGPEFGYHVKPGFNVELASGSLNESQSLASNSVNGAVNVNLSGAALVGTYHPHDHAFGYDVGYVFRNATSSLNAVPGTNGVTINGDTYTSAQINNVNASFTLKSAPVIGVDYSKWLPHSGLQFHSALGYVIGSPVNASVNPNLPAGSPLIGNAQFNSDVSSAQSKIRSAAQAAGAVYFSIGLSERF